MKDQAEGLRELASTAKKKAGDAEAAGARKASGKMAAMRARSIAVTSGKGGVGKTNLTINLAIEAAKRGKSVLVVDADWGLANADVVMGITPDMNISHFVRGEASLDEIIYDGPGGIRLIPNGSGLSELANLSQARQKRLFAALAELEESVDLVMLDTGAGISDKVLNYVYSAGDAIVVVTPEPTSIRDAYAVIKTVLKKSPRSRLQLVVNMAADHEEGMDVGRRIVAVAEQFLGKKIELLGVVTDDKAMPRSVMEQVPIVLGAPRSEAARDISNIATTLFGQLDPSAASNPDPDQLSFFKRLSRLFSGD